MEKWWKKSVVYQIYVRSFQDSNNDGIGDLNGITARLNYLKTLGVDVLWLTPIYESPNEDNGYDISNYYAISKEYGTMDDFEHLLSEAHKRNIKIIMDIVFNHTSDQHLWFTQSRKSKDNPYRDYYIWKDAFNGHEPNNWTSSFQGSAWEYDQQTSQYYLHLFSKRQPDLNWQNENVRIACYDVMNFWVDKGIDGFRLDVINLISKNEEEYYVNSSVKGHTVCANGPNVHKYLQEMNKNVFSKKTLLTVGETPAVTVEDAIQYAPQDGSELSMVFQFELMNVDGAEENKWTDRRYCLKDLKNIMTRWQTGMYHHAWNSLFWNNHDQPRCVSRFGNTSTPFYYEKSAKMLAICLHMMQGTPFIFQGEEIGMTNVPFNKLDDYRDIETINAYHQLVEVEKKVTSQDMLRYLLKSSRDHARTPMQWDSTSNAGFSQHEPWIMVNPNYIHINVDQELQDRTSIFYTYQKLIQLRKELEIITEGSYQLLLAKHEQIFAYKRLWKNEELIVFNNFSQNNVIYDTSLVPDKATIILSNYKEHRFGELAPYESVVFLKKSY